MIPQVLSPGSNLQSKYQVERLLGQGGFGITYLAVHEELGKKVAIKELFLNTPKVFCTREETDQRTVRPHFGQFEAFKKHFQQEARTLARFTGSKGIVQVNDIFQENNTVYFVMDFVEGISLSQLVERRGALPEQEVVGYAGQILQTLITVHREGVLHRDLKPDNLILRHSDGQLVLIDFGIAREFVEGKTQVQTVMLSEGFAPPEQKLPTARRSASMDLYGVGAVLYFCLTRQRPQTTDEIVMEGYKSPRDRNPSISTDLDSLINKALEKNPANRFQSAEEMLRALQDGQRSALAASNSSQRSEKKLLGPKTRQSEVTEVFKEMGGEDTALFPEQNGLRIDASGNLTEIVKGVAFTMVYVEGGTFLMGDVMDDGEFDNEKPVHEVHLDGYYLAETLVTQELWCAVMAEEPANNLRKPYRGPLSKNDSNNPSSFKGCEQCPVEKVSWENIVNDFLPRLNRFTGRKYRLPTEAEWEYAARERGKNVRFGNGKNIADPKEMNFYAGASGKRPYSVVGECREKTTPVKTFAPNALGLYDMSGNVWEWCADWYGSYSAEPQVNPKGPSSGTARVNRGGGWSVNPQGARVSHRNSDVPTACSRYLGFRLALSL